MKYKETETKTGIKIVGMFGRYRKVTIKQLQEKLKKYKEKCKKEKKPMTFMGFATFVGIHKSTISKWKKEEDSPYAEFAELLETEIEADIAERAMTGNANPTFAIFYLKCKHNWRDGEQEQAKQPITIEFVKKETDES